MRAWSKPMESLLRQSGYTYRQFRMFLIWATRLRGEDGANYGNTFSAEYLRSARDPMLTLVKQFDSLFYTFFLPRADKMISILEDKLQREKDEASRAKYYANQPNTQGTVAPQPPSPEVIRGWNPEERALSFLVAMRTQPFKLKDTDYDYDPTSAKLEAAFAARRVTVIDHEAEIVRHMRALDARFPMLNPAPDETVEEWVMRETRPFRNPDWRCQKCQYGIDTDELDRAVWCADCAEEVILWCQDGEDEWDASPTVSCLTLGLRD